MKKVVKDLTQYLLLLLLLTSASLLHAQNPLAPDKVLARSPRVAVTYSDFEAELARIPQGDRFELLLSREKVAVLVDNILINKTLALEARENKLDASPLVQAEIANQTEKVLAKYRGQQVQANLPKIDLLPRARERYLTSPEKITRPELHDVWHVLVGLKGRTLEQAQARAEEVRKKVLAGEPRGQVAEEYSDDPSKRNNQGNLGLSNLSGFDPRFSAAVKGMKAGDVAIAESSYGVHVIKLLGHTPSTRIPFETAKPTLMYEAETEYVLAAWNSYLRNISNDPKLFVDIEALDALRPKLPEIPTAPPSAPIAAPTVPAAVKN